MASLPEDPSCVVHDGERVELTPDHVVMPDGSTRLDLNGCTLESGAVLVVEYSEQPATHRTKDPEDAPLPDAVSDSIDATTVVMLPPAPPPLPPQATVNPVTVAIAASALIASGAIGWQALKASNNPTMHQPQQTEEQRQRAECGTRSDSVLIDFRASVADAKTRRLPHIVEPRELWQRADALEAQVDHLRRILRAMAKTRRA